MLKRIITTKQFGIWFLIISELILAGSLKFDHSLSIIGITIVCIFWAVLSHIFIAWLKYEDEFKELKEMKSQTETLLNEFAESNHLLERVTRTAKNDLEFDKYIKTKSEHKPFQLFLSALKYDYYLSSYFIYNQDGNSPAITKIPRHFFEDYRSPNGEKHSIWMWLIDKTMKYKSIQVLNSQTIDIYIRNKERAETEANFLRTQYQNKKARLISIEKLFVITDSWLSKDGKNIIDTHVNELLDIWKCKLNTMTKISRKDLQVKFISINEAKGSLSNDYIEDIGIFDNILGIQKPENTDKSLINDGTDISFYFEPQKVNKWKDNFDTIFKRSEFLIKDP